MKKLMQNKYVILIVSLLLTILISYFGYKYEIISNVIDISFQVFTLIMIILFIFIYCVNVLPTDLKRLKLKRLISKEDFATLENFLDIDEPNDDEAEFLTFLDTSSAAINITILSKEDLSFVEPLEFTKEEKECIKNYRNQNTDKAKYLCYYYDKCNEIIKIINKYYDSTGKLKKK